MIIGASNPYPIDLFISNRFVQCDTTGQPVLTPSKACVASQANFPGLFVPIVDIEEGGFIKKSYVADEGPKIINAGVVDKQTGEIDYNKKIGIPMGPHKPAQNLSEKFQNDEGTKALFEHVVTEIFGKRVKRLPAPSHAAKERMDVVRSATQDLKAAFYIPGGEKTQTEWVEAANKFIHTQIV